MSETRSKCLAALVLLSGCLAPILLIWHGWGAYLPGIPRSDFEFYFYPQRVFLSRWLSQGVFPWWNPHLFCGYPTVEIQQTALFYPFNTLSLMLFPPTEGLLIVLSLHVILAQILTFLGLQKACQLSPLAAASGSTVYILGAVFSHRFMSGHLTVIFAMSWIPFAICMLIAYLSDRKPASFVATAVATGIVILAGAPQYVFYLFWSQFAVALTARGSWKIKAAALAGVWVVAAAISAPQWLPTLFYLGFGARSIGATGLTPTEASRAVWMLEYLLRSPLGDGITTQHLQTRGVWDTAGYTGTITALLAIGSLIGTLKRYGGATPGARAAVAVLCVALYHGMGGWLPGFGFFREPLKAMCLVNLATAILAGCALDELFRPSQNLPIVSSRRYVLTGALLTLVGLGIAACCLAAPREVAHWLLRISETQRGSHAAVQALAEEANSSPQVIIMPLLQAAANLSALSVAFVVLFALRRRSVFLVSVVLSILLVADPLSAHWRAIQSNTPRTTSGWPKDLRTKIGQVVIQNNSNSRFTIPTPMTNGSQLIPGMYEPYGYDPMMPRLAGSRTIVPAPGQSPDEIRKAKFRALAASHSIEEDPSLQPETIPQSLHTYSLSAVSTASVMAHLTPVVLPADDSHEFGPLPGNRDFVSDDTCDLIPNGLMGKNETTFTKITASSVHQLDAETPNTLNFDIDSDGPNLLVVHSSYLPGWYYSVNGGPTALPACINGWMIGIPVKSGEQQVTLKYRPVGIAPSIVTSLIALLGCTTALFISRRRETH
ncbi:MAG: YfhO family protein [Candidatus Sumerlaeaceae bacterium]|nr:YfhO family protein [Candidatus Sumerlaeaceae bacterium]